MKDRIVSFKLAEAAKKKGFNWRSEKYYSNDGNIDEGTLQWSNSDFSDGESSAPTHYALARWLRENYNIHVIVNPKCHKLNRFTWCVITTHGIFVGDGIKYEDHDDAMDNGLLEAIDMI